jgi:hypothetical protein
MGVASPMAKKKKTGPKPKPEGTREELIALKCRSDFKDWVSEFARKLRTNPSQLIDRALTKLAQTEGFREPPER